MLKTQPIMCFSARHCTLVKSLLTAVFLTLLANSLMAGPLIIMNLPAESTCSEIQNALDGLPENGEVLLAPGTYAIQKPIIVRQSHTALCGSGASTILVLAANANCPVIIVGAPLGQTNQVTSDVRVADMTIDGNRTNQTVEMWRAASDNSQLNNNGIDIWNTLDATVENVICAHCRSGGLVAAVGIKRLTVRDYTAFDNQYDGLACYSTEDSHFSNLNLYENLGAGISLDLAFNHNVIDHAVLKDNDLGVFMRQSRDNVFEGITIAHSHNHGVFIAQTAFNSPTGWILVPGTECTGNKFNQLSIQDCGGSAFRVNDLSCTNNFITNSSFLSNSKGGLAIDQPNLVSVSQLVER